jgi:hypothetical protein
MIIELNFVEHFPRNDHISGRVFPRGSKCFRMLIANTNNVLKLVSADDFDFDIIFAVIRKAQSDFTLEFLCLIGFRVCINCGTD